MGAIKYLWVAANQGLMIAAASTGVYDHRRKKRSGGFMAEQKSSNLYKSHANILNVKQ
jgi:hypothetical protein